MVRAAFYSELEVTDITQVRLNRILTTLLLNNIASQVKISAQCLREKVTETKLNLGNVVTTIGELKTKGK